MIKFVCDSCHREESHKSVRIAKSIGWKRLGTIVQDNYNLPICHGICNICWHKKRPIRPGQHNPMVLALLICLFLGVIVITLTNPIKNPPTQSNSNNNQYIVGNNLTACLNRLQAFGDLV